jgi:hypothetical protein
LVTATDAPPGRTYYDLATTHPELFDASRALGEGEHAGWACERRRGLSRADRLLTRRPGAPLPDHLCPRAIHLPVCALNVRTTRPAFGSPDQADQYRILARIWPLPATAGTLAACLRHFGHPCPLVAPLLPGAGQRIGLFVQRDVRAGEISLFGPALERGAHRWQFDQPIVQTLRAVRPYEAGKDVQMEELREAEHALVQWYKRVAQGRPIRGPGQTDNRTWRTREGLLAAIAEVVERAPTKWRKPSRRWLAARLHIDERTLRAYIGPDQFGIDWEREVVPLIFRQ